MKESSLMRLITDYLDAKRYLYIRNNSGATKIGDRFVRFGQKGSPDLLVFYKKTYAVEAKADKGKQSPEQVEWQERFEKSGAGEYILARSLEDIMQII